MIDFIIVGRGLAANVLAHNFHKNNISFNLIGNDKLSNCSNAAAGIWNPVVFKRLTKSWLAQDLISCLNKFYTECELRVNSKFLIFARIGRASSLCFLQFVKNATLAVGFFS